MGHTNGIEAWRDSDTEEVEVWSRELKRKQTTCKLAVGTHGLPVLLNQVPPMQVWEFPSNWMLLPDNRHPPGTLLAAWRAIEDVMTELAEWERRHDSCGKEEQQGDILQWDGNATSTSGQCPGTLLELKEDVGP